MIKLDILSERSTKMICLAALRHAILMAFINKIFPGVLSPVAIEF